MESTDTFKLKTDTDFKNHGYCRSISWACHGVSDTLSLFPEVSFVLRGHTTSRRLFHSWKDGGLHLRPRPLPEHRGSWGSHAVTRRQSSQAEAVNVWPGSARHSPGAKWGFCAELAGGRWLTHRTSACPIICKMELQGCWPPRDIFKWQLLLLFEPQRNVWLSNPIRDIPRDTQAPSGRSLPPFHTSSYSYK